MIKETYKVKSIKKELCKEWLLYKHYAKRIPTIIYSFGLFEKNVLVGVLTIGNSPSKDLTHNVLNGLFVKNVFELNRLCVNDGLEKNVLSYFVSNVLKKLPKPLVLVSYADKSVGHNGYIYQATNWIYTGLSYKRKEWREIGTNKHSRTLCGQYSTKFMYDNPHRFERVERAQKHRYIFFIGSKKQRKKMFKNLKYKVLPYPKGQNTNYDASYKTTNQTELF
tara:strand:+ start:777 stop:1442 length:666 start_codon:yes stop_codon:yes gene_type:complete